MKSYFKSYDELATAWVAGTCSSDSYTDKLRMLAFGPRIYSYGDHFCIARKWQAPDTGRVWYLVTERRYSPTTLRHVCAVSRAIPSEQRVYLPQVDNLTDLAWPELKLLVPDFRIDLTSPDAKEEQLGLLSLHLATQRLDYHINKYLRSTRPGNPEYYLNGWFDQSAASVARFGLTLPSRFSERRDQCAAHYRHRSERNAMLDATLPSRRRLLAA